MTTDQYRETRSDPPAGLAAFNSPRFDLVLAPYGIFVLRMAIGIDWIVHALLKTYRGMYTHGAQAALVLAGSGAFALQGRRR